jgi:hypothetical protein
MSIKNSSLESQQSLVSSNLKVGPGISRRGHLSQKAAGLYLKDFLRKKRPSVSQSSRSLPSRILKKVVILLKKGQGST